MKKILRLSWCLTLLFLAGQSIRTTTLWAQVPTLIPKPDENEGNYTGYVDAGRNSPPSTPIVFNNALYSAYTDANGKGRLSKFDGTTITLIPNPDTGPGYFGNQIVFDGAIYGHYTDENHALRMARYNGNRLTLLPNPTDLSTVGLGYGYNDDSFLVVFNNALYCRYYDINRNYRLVRIEPASATAQSFAITGVTGVSCRIKSANQRTLVFTPQYAGLTGQPVSFSVVNELLPTNNAGPYTLDLYVDNPTITLRAVQVGTPAEVSYAFNWLPTCGNLRQGVAESQTDLRTTVMPNPSSGQTIDVEVRGATGQPVDFLLEDERGKPVSHLRVEEANDIERNAIRLGSAPGIYFLKINSSTGAKTIKVLRK